MADRYSDRSVQVITLTAGSASAYSSTVDFQDYAGMGLYLDSSFAGTIAIQASHDDTTWANLYDNGGALVQFADTYKGAWITIDADAYPYPYVRLARTDGAGGAVAGTVVFTFIVSLKS